jgi:outer membrane PBP1 activator LpoA protein
MNLSHILGLSQSSPLKRAKQQLHDTEMERLESSRMAEYYNAMTDMLAERKDRLETYIECYGKSIEEIDRLHTGLPKDMTIPMYPD